MLCLRPLEDCDLSLFKNIYDDDGNQIPNPDYKPPNDARHEAFKNTFSAALFKGLPLPDRDQFYALYDAKYENAREIQEHQELQSEWIANPFYISF